MNFQQKLDSIIAKNNSLVCVGLDSDFSKLPESLKQSENPQFAFNKAIIDATHDLVCAYKPNSAFYEALGSSGVEELKMTCDYVRETYPEIPIILDAKRADIGNTNEGYAKYIFDYLQADAVTLQPYLGGEAIKPFLDRADKGIIILCRTSNSGAGEFQDLHIPVILNEGEAPYQKSVQGGESQLSNRHPELVSGSTQSLYLYVARKVVSKWNVNNNCLLVVGATYPEELAKVRKITGDMTFLVPGIGAQGGEVEATVKAGLNSKKAGMIINSSRGIIFAENPREETIKLRDQINSYR